MDANAMPELGFMTFAQNNYNRQTRQQTTDDNRQQTTDDNKMMTHSLTVNKNNFHPKLNAPRKMI